MQETTGGEQQKKKRGKLCFFRGRQINGGQASKQADATFSYPATVVCSGLIQIIYLYHLYDAYT